ncbi:MAG TPA: GxxExxY protein [Planctomycetota bacterium]|nr:GxxExxY protein [Planctomycetota bacterium]
MFDIREPDPSTDALANSVIGAAIEVHRHLGPGFLEDVYEEAMAIEMVLRQIPFERQKHIAVDYKERLVGRGRLDFLVGDQLVVELKSVTAIAPIEVARVISYLRAYRRDLALVINFNVRILKDGIQRVVVSGRPPRVET